MKLKRMEGAKLIVTTLARQKDFIDKHGNVIAQQFADFTGMAQPSVSRILRVPDAMLMPNTVKKICKAFKLTREQVEALGKPQAGAVIEHKAPADTPRARRRMNGAADPDLMPAPVDQGFLAQVIVRVMEETEGRGLPFRDVRDMAGTVSTAYAAAVNGVDAAVKEWVSGNGHGRGR